MTQITYLRFGSTAKLNRERFAEGEDYFVANSSEAAGRFSLNALHRASAAPESKKPSNWLDLKQTKELIKELKYQRHDSTFGPNLDHNAIQGVTYHLDNRGYTSKVELNKHHSMTLVTGYSVELRHRVNGRWKFPFIFYKNRYKLVSP